MFERLIELLITKNIISAAESELYLFGLRNGFYLVINILTVLLLGILCSMFWQSIIFLAFYIPLRHFSGGFHAKTSLGCYIFSTCLMLAVFCGIKLIPWTTLISSLIVSVSFITIFLLAPVEDLNKPFDQIEFRMFRECARKVIIVELVVYILFIYASMYQVSYCISLSFLVMAVMLLLGAFTLRKRTANDAGRWI